MAHPELSHADTVKGSQARLDRTSFTNDGLGLSKEADASPWHSRKLEKSFDLSNKTR